MADSLTRDDYINQFRQSFPERSSWTDDDILDAYADQNKDDLQNHPVLAAHAQKQAEDNTSILTEAKGAFGAGVDNLQGKLYDTAAMAGDLVHSDRLKQWGEEGRDRNSEEASAYDPVVKSFENVRTPKDFAYWMTNVVGGAVPQIAGGLAAGAAGAGIAALAAPEAAIVGGVSAVAEAAATRMAAIKLGSTIGSAIFGFSQTQNYGELSKEGGENVVPLSVANGLIGGVLQSIPVTSLVSKALGREVSEHAAKGAVQTLLEKYINGPLVNVALNAAKQGNTVMLTNLATEASTLAAEMISNRDNPDFHLDDSQVRSRLINSAVSGFMLGGLTGGAESLVHNDAPNFAEGDPRAVTNLADKFQRPAFMPQEEVAPAEQMVEAEAAPVPNAISPAAPDASVTLATPEQQQYLISRGMPADSAATIPAHEASLAILQYKADASKAQDAQEAAAQKQQASSVQAQQEAAIEAQAAAQEKARQQAAAEDEIRNSQMGEAADDHAQELRSQLSAARQGPEVSQEAGRRMSRGLKKTTEALQPEKPNVAPGLLVESNKAPVEGETINPADLPRSLTPGKQVAEPETAPAQTGTPLMQDAPPALAPAPVAPPVAGPAFAKLDDTPMRRFIDRDSSKSPESATKLDKGHDRWQAFQTEDGKVELRKVSTNGTLAVRENMDATPKSIRDSLEKNGTKVSQSTVENALKGENVRQKQAILDEATRQGYSREDGRAERVTAKELEESGRHYLGTVEIPEGSGMSHFMKMSQAEYDSAFGKSRELGESKGIAKVGRAAPKVTATIASDMSQRLSALPTAELQKFTVLPGKEETRTLYETSLKAVATPEAVDAYNRLTNAKKTERAQAALADALSAVSKEKLAPTAPSIAAGTPSPVAEAVKPVPQLSGSTVTSSSPVPAAIRFVPSADHMAALVEKTFGGTEKARSIVDKMTPAQSAAAMEALITRGKTTGLSADQQTALRDFRALSPNERLGLHQLFKEQADRAIRSMEDHIDPDVIDDRKTGIDTPKKSVLFRSAPDDYLAPQDRVDDRYTSMVREASARGLDVVQSQAKAALKEGGAYNPNNRTVSLVLSNVTEPNVRDITTLVHEVIHDSLEGQPDWVKTLVHDAFERLPNGDLSFFNNPEADARVSSGRNVENLPREEYLIERAVEHATLLGLSRDYAQGVIPAIWRTVKNYLLKGAMYLQQKLLGEENTGGTLAKSFMENLAAQFISGDKSSINGFLKQFGHTPSFGEIQRYLPVGSDRVQRMRINPETGTPMFDFSGETSTLAARHNIEGPLFAAKENIAQNDLISERQATREIRGKIESIGALLRLSPDVPNDMLEAFKAGLRDMTANTEMTVALANHWDGRHSAKIDKLTAIIPPRSSEDIAAARRDGRAVADNFTRERYFQLLRTADPKSVVAEAMTTLQEALENELQKKVSDLGVDPTHSLDKMTVPQQGKADLEILSESSRHAARIANAIEDNRVAQISKKSDIATRQARLLEITNKIADFKTTERYTTEKIISGLKDLTDQVNRAHTGAVKEANAVLSALEDQTTDSAVIDDAGRLRKDLKLTQRLAESMDVPSLPLLSIFKELFSVEQAYKMDLADARPQDIRAAILEHVQANSDSSLRHLVNVGDGPDAHARGTALLSSVIAFAQNEAVTADALRLQFSKASDRAQQMIAVRDAMKGSNEDSSFRQLRKDVMKDLSRPGNRLIQSLLNENDKLLKEQTHAANLEQDEKVLKSALPVFEEGQRRAAARHEVSGHFALVPDALILNPATTELSAAEVEHNAEPLRMSRENYSKSEEMRDVIRNQNAWLKARDDDPQYVPDKTYTQMKRQNEVLHMAGIDHDVQIMDGVGRGAMLHGPAEMATRTGMPSGQVLGKAIQAVETWKRSMKDPNQVNGKKWESAQTEFYKHTKGLDNQWVHSALYDYGLDYMNFERSLSREGGLDALRQIFIERGGISADLMRKDTTWKAFSKWLTVSDEVNRAKTKESVDAGNRVRDDRINVRNSKTGDSTTADRMPVDQSLFNTGGRQPNKTIRAVLWGMIQRKQMLGDGENNPFADASLRVKTNPEGVRAAWMDLMKNPDFAGKVVDPLILNFKPTLPAPERTSGVKVPLSPSIAHAVWAESGKDIMKFGEGVTRAVLGDKAAPEAVEKYQIALLGYLDGRMKLITKGMMDANAADNNRLGGMPHVAMDARQSNDLPSEWMEYPTFSVKDLDHMSHVSAVNGFLGRDLEIADRLSDNISKELNGLADLMPPTQKMRDALKKENPEKFEQIERASNLAKAYGEGYFGKTLRNMLDPSMGATGDFGLAREFFQVGVLGMLSGVRTSLRDLASLIRPFQIEKSLSLDTLKSVGDNLKYATQYSLASVTNALLGTDLMANDPSTKAIERAGFGDPARVMLLKELMTGSHGRNDSLDKTTAGQITMAIRRLRDVAGLGRLGFNEGAAGPALRMNPFPWATQVQIYTGIKTYMKRTAQLVQRASDFYKANPDRVGDTLSAKDLGLNNPIAYETLKDKLAFNGISIESLGEKISRMDNPQYADLLDDRTVRGIASFIMDEQLVESSPNTRPVWTQTSKLGRLSGAIVGWSLGNTAQLTNLYRDSSRRASVKTVLNATAVTMLGMIPSSVAVSLLVDQYDKQLTKKIPNELPITGADWMQSAFERSVNLGTLGLPGELVAAFTTSRDGSGTRALSVDQRIVWVNALQQLVTSLDNIHNVGIQNANYANFWRPMASNLGAGGLLQNIQLFEGLFGDHGAPVLKDEADITNRTNINNWLRVGGRQVGLEEKKFNQGGQSTMNAVTPWITNMALAALANDADSFKDAYKKAVIAAADLPAAAGDSAKYVRDSFASRNPLKGVFNISPTPTEIQLVLRGLPPEGQEAVVQGLSLYNRYSEAIGAKPFNGAPGTSAVALQRAQGRNLGLSSSDASMSQIRAELAARRSSLDE